MDDQTRELINKILDQLNGQSNASDRGMPNQFPDKTKTHNVGAEDITPAVIDGKCIKYWNDHLRHGFAVGFSNDNKKNIKGFPGYFTLAIPKLYIHTDLVGTGLSRLWWQNNLARWRGLINDGANVLVIAE